MTKEEKIQRIMTKSEPLIKLISLILYFGYKYVCLPIYFIVIVLIGVPKIILSNLFNKIAYRLNKLN